MPQLKRHPPPHQNRPTLPKFLTAQTLLKPPHLPPPPHNHKRCHTIHFLRPPSRQTHLAARLWIPAPAEDGLEAGEVGFNLGFEVGGGGREGAVDEFGQWGLSGGEDGGAEVDDCGGDGGGGDALDCVGEVLVRLVGR